MTSGNFGYGGQGGIDAAIHAAASTTGWDGFGPEEGLSGVSHDASSAPWIGYDPLRQIALQSPSLKSRP